MSKTCQRSWCGGLSKSRHGKAAEASKTTPECMADAKLMSDISYMPESKADWHATVVIAGSKCMFRIVPELCLSKDHMRIHPFSLIWHQALLEAKTSEICTWLW